MAARLTFLAALLLCLVSLTSAKKCIPRAIPIVQNPVQTIQGSIKLYVTDLDSLKRTPRYPLTQSNNIPNFGFFQAANLLKPGKKPLSVTLASSQLFNDFGGTLSSRSKKDMKLYFAADSTAIPEVVHAVDVCSAAGDMVQVLAYRGPLNQLIYQRFSVNGTLAPGKTLLQTGNNGAGFTKVDVVIEKA